MYDKRLCAGGRFFEPERAEIWELLAGRLCRVYGEAAGGQTVDVASADGTEIGCALEDRKLLMDAGLFRFSAQAEAGISKAVINGQVREFVGLVEHAKVEFQGTGSAVFDDRDINRMRVKQPRCKHVEVQRRVGLV